VIEEKRSLIDLGFIGRDIFWEIVVSARLRTDVD
jgi:hypothetical protein